MNRNYDIDAIENVLCDVVRKGHVTERVFKGQRPNVDSPMTDFCVVSVVTSVKDRGAFGECICRIELFAKNLSTGEKNGKKLSVMYSKLSAVFPIIHDTYIFEIFPNILPLGGDKYGFNAIAIQLNTLIKTFNYGNNTNTNEGSTG